MITKRGKRLRAVLILIAIIAAWKIAGNLWWNGSEFCWGSMTKCVGL